MQHGLQTQGNYFELRQQHAHALGKAESIVAAAERAGRKMTDDEQKDFDMAMAAVRSLAPKIAAIQAQNTVRVTDSGVVVDGKRHYHAEPQRVLSQDYLDAFNQYITSRGTKIDAALYEGGATEGG